MLDKGFFKAYSEENEILNISDIVSEFNAEDSPDNLIRLLLISSFAHKDLSCLRIMGLATFYGNNIKQNQEKGLSILKRAVEQGDRRSIYILGHLYYDLQEYMKAIEYLSEALRSDDIISEDERGHVHQMLGEAYVCLAEPKFSQAIETLTVGAEKYHDHFCAVVLGNIFSDKEIREYDKDKAITYYRMAASWGNLEAAAKLARHYIGYDDWFGLPVDYSEVEKLLLPFKDSDDVEVLTLLGRIYANGDEEHGVKEDIDKAADYYARVYDLEPSPYNAAYLGYTYYKLQRYQDAEKLLKYADENDSVIFSDFLGRIYKDGLADGRKDSQKGLRYYDRMYDVNGYLNNVYTAIEYVELLQEENNHEKVFEVSQKSLKEYNDVFFAYNLGKLVLYDLVEGKMSKSEGANMLEICARQNYEAEQCHLILAAHYMKSHEYRKAENHYLDAFEAGNVDCAVRLGKLYERGGGSITADINKAIKWYTIAAENGSEAGARELSCFKKGLFGGYKRVRSS